MKKTKIICSIGPASVNPDIMEEMVKNGMNVARINFSHGTHEMHEKTIELFRSVRDELGLPAAVLLDTKGPEIRTGLIEGEYVELTEGKPFKLTVNDVLGNSDVVSVTYNNLPNLVNAGDIVPCLNRNGRDLTLCTNNDFVAKGLKLTRTIKLHNLPGCS